jgi:hypothetical protein
MPYELDKEMMMVWGCSSETVWLPGMHKALGSISAERERQRERENGRMVWRSKGGCFCRGESNSSGL